MISVGRAVAEPATAAPMLMVIARWPPGHGTGRAATAFRSRSAATHAPSRSVSGNRDRELLAADPRGHVGLARARAAKARDRDDRLVADIVAVGVIDRLEVIDIEHDERERPPVAAVAISNSALEPHDEMPAVMMPVKGSIVASCASSSAMRTRSPTLP